MKYADSFRHAETLDTTSTTTYSQWYDVSWANELYAFIGSVETGTPNSESIVTTIERGSGFETDVPITVLTFSTITADTTEELYARHDYDGGAPAADNKIGMRIRYKFVTSGTWSVTNVIVTVNVHAKRN